MLRGGHLFAFVELETVISGAVLFDIQTQLIVDRIFLSPRRFRQGLGRQLMSAIEALNTRHLPIVLDTPCWNARTLPFYRRCGYVETHRDADSVFFRKEYPQS